MKRIFLTGLFASLIAVACFAQKPYKVVFYNFENLFDTIHDPGVLDEEFTPEGPKKWNSAKYTRKIGNLERVLFDIAAEDKDYPVVIGVSEIENRSVMEDVIAQPKLAPGNYRIVHYDSPDARGVDVAFYYRPDVFKLEGSAAIPFKMPELPMASGVDRVAVARDRSQTRNSLIHGVEVRAHAQGALLCAAHLGGRDQLHRLCDLHGGLHRFDTAFDVLHVSGCHCSVPPCCF